jgi:hypothetical protein
MPVFTIETPRGRKVKIEAADQATAIRGAERWDLQDHATSEAKRLGVDPGLVIAVGEQESGWNPSATSPKGARGAMQLMPATAQELGVNPDDPYENITGGITYLRRQLDTFGDERKALAAYNAGPGAVQKYGGVPPFRETQAYVEAITSGRGGEVAEAELTAGPVPRTPPPGVLPPAATPAPRRAPASQGLGFIKGATDPYATALDRQQTARGLLPQAAQAGLAVADVTSPLGILGQLGAMGVRQAQKAVQGRMAQGERPGAIGEFAGNVTATLPAWVLGPMSGGALSGAMSSTADDVGGLLRDTGIGLAAGKIGDEVARFVAPKVGAALSKTAKPPTQEALRVAKKAAYDRLKALGGAYTGASKANLLAKFRADMARDGLDQGANPGAWAVFQRAEKVLGGRGPISLDDLDNLRQTAWRQAAGLKGADKEAERYYGEAMIRLIDDFVDTTTPSSLSGATGPELSAAIKEARKANQIWRKTERINNTLESADLRAAAAYTGTNTDNTIRQQVRPLIDPTSSSRMRGVTPDEKKALERVVRGSVGQNVARTTGQLVDPRRLLGMGLQGAGGVATGGLSLMSAPIGVLNTVLSNRASQQNVQRLLSLIAAGGSKQAQVKVPTVTSRAIQAAMTAAPLAAPVGAVRLEDQRRNAGQTRR